MKKYILSLAVLSLFYTKSDACAWSDPDYEYFNLFTQSIIKDKSYLPFLHSYSTRFYTDFKQSQIPDENIESWRKFFNNQLSYAETDFMVNKMSMNDLNELKKGTPNNALLTKLGTGFYQKYHEGIDYLIEAKYLEPYMKINYVESADSFYYRENSTDKNATNLDYPKTISALTSLYNAAKNPEIKQRYGYQLVRFNHYTRNYDAALQAFKTYVEPVKLKGAPYFMSLDQLAGAQRGLQMNSDANWNFFQVFMNSKSRKESAFVSMKLSDTASFNNILKRAGTNEEKNMGYFLLGYEDFTNPIPIMEKMFDINPDSEILKVMAVRSINELERSYLPTYYYASTDNGNNSTAEKSTTNTHVDPAKAETPEVKEKELSFWQKIVRFFKKLFGIKSDPTTENNKADQSDDELLDNPNRIPFYTKNQSYYYDDKQKDFLDDLEKFTEKTKTKSKDEYWQIADAYLKFLKKDYKASTEILEDIKTNNPEYLEEIKRMKVLNDIVSQPKITAEYEDHLMKDYAEYFVEKEVKKDSTQSDYDSYYGPVPSTASFLKDVLANRYFLQGEDGKSFLMSNKLSDLQYNPNSSLVKSVEDFYRKPNKSQFEQQIIAKNINDVGNIDAFFSVIYGDRAMRMADFEKAKSYYQKAQSFTGIPRLNYEWTENNQKVTPRQYAGTEYNGFKNISNLIFGHNVWESFESADNISMETEDYSAFPFIKNSMNKLELSDALIQLKKIGSGKDEKAAQANQLIGNLLYNTSILGYYREVFVMDIDNSNGGKYDFWNTDKKTPYQYYYKNFLDSSYIEPDNFDVAINYYKKALDLSNNKDQKARVLFQMASAEQGKYYQYEAKNPSKIDYSDPKYSEKSDAYQIQLNDIKNQKYRTYFAILKSQYADAEVTKNLMGSCSYFSYFMK
ncbi:hypothetical protein [Chryseobacterium limigenitum]|uniref:Tetratricopeptide repeat-containing protein n=1 Tax=Chryseobacterium limigenitum TaxID=1612149 RepID=A0A1K2IFQ0_9FLAO|nr:hypothetical protein [Chryseobacterium limigenitum]SFZ91241.1 hypothetical protein SAMN05216324_102222 [Chryseobacterium limigenitum]